MLKKKTQNHPNPPFQKKAPFSKNDLDIHL